MYSFPAPGQEGPGTSCCRSRPIPVLLAAISRWGLLALVISLLNG